MMVKTRRKGQAGYPLILSLLWVSLISITLGMQHTVISPVLANIGAAFPEVSRNTLQLLVSIPNLLAIAAAASSAWLMRRLGKKTVMLICLLIIFISGAGMAFAGSFPALMALRSVSGIGYGFILPVGTALIMEHAQGRERDLLLGAQAAMVGVGGLFSSLAAGYLGAADFHTAFLLYLVAGAAALVCLLLVPAGRHGEQARKTAAGDPMPMGILLTLMAFHFLFMMCILVFQTNIAEAVSLHFQGGSAFSGWMVALNAAAQFVSGCGFAAVNRRLGNRTSIGTFLIGGAGFALLCCFSASIPLVAAGSILCGVSQSLAFPAMIGRCSALITGQKGDLAITLMAVSMNVGALVSPAVMNGLAGGGTQGAFMSAAVLLALMALAGAAARPFRTGKQRNGSNQMEQ